MPIITTGGPDFSGIAEDINRINISQRAQALDEQRYQTLKRRVDQEMENSAAEEARRKREDKILQQSRATTPGLIEGMFKRPEPPNVPDAGTVGPSDPNSEDAQFQAAIRSNTERMGKMAAEIAKSDPNKGMEFARRFLDEEQQNLHRLVADRGITKMMKDIGEGLTTPGVYGPHPFGDQAPEDPTYQEAMKGVLQTLQAAQGPEVSPEDKIRALKDANDSRKEIRKDITARNEKNAATAAARDTVAARIAESAGRLTTDQKARLGSLTANVGFEEGMIPPSKVDSEIERIMRGTVQVPNPFSFGGGDETLEMTPDSAAKFQETLARIAKLQAEQGATDARAQASRSAAGFNDARASGKLVLPGKNGAARGPLADEKDIAQIMRDRFPAGATGQEAAAADTEKALREKLKGPDSADKLKADILGKKLTRGEATARAQALGISPEQLQALLGGK